MDVFRLEGKTALITGGGTGLGLGIARCFVQAGAKVRLVGRREAPLRDAVTELGANARYSVCDVTDFQAVERMVEQAESEPGGISILVNNAGIHLKKPAAETTESEFEAVLRTHVVAAFGLTRRLIPPMTQRGEGTILFTASMASIFGLPYVVAYSAAKSAYLGIVRSLAAELSGNGVRVNAIAPGWIQSEMLEKALRGDEERKQRILSRTPMKRFGSPDDIGWAAVYLSSPAAQFVTGVVLPVDGGASIGF
ncbi:MAG: glucose 1-dehydrogenase [Bryobacterales bacterium]|nr:glucose 1-dehydrogenase [Bryobacterales bacterium]